MILVLSSLLFLYANLNKICLRPSNLEHKNFEKRVWNHTKRLVNVKNKKNILTSVGKDNIEMFEKIVDVSNSIDRAKK